MDLGLALKLIDTHAHLDFPEFDPDRDAVVDRALASGIDYIVNVGSSVKGSFDSVELASRYSCIYAAVGIHPHEADSCSADSNQSIRELAKNNKVVAIGEIGLDYYKNFSQAGNQRALFISSLKLAKDLGLPVVLHSRNAEADTIKMVKDFMPLKAVVHCFSGDGEFLRNCLDLGFFVSYTCNITFKKAQGLRDVLRITPLERMMLETDAPYLSPEGFRGKRNEPARVKLLAEEIGGIKGTSAAEVAKATSSAAREFFKLP